MKVIEPNPIIWGYKHGYAVADIADGLGLSDFEVRNAIARYEERRAVAEIMLRAPLAAGTISRVAYWQREVLGAREALARIEQDRIAAYEERLGR